jgi:hypothetical protein
LDLFDFSKGFLSIVFFAENTGKQIKTRESLWK